MKYYTVPIKAMEGHEMYRRAEAPAQREMQRLTDLVNRGPRQGIALY